MAFTRQVLSIPVDLAGLAGTGALNLVDSLSLGFKYAIESIRWLTTQTLTGSGGTQDFEIRAGATTGTVLATLTASLASHSAAGATAVAAVAAAQDGASYISADTGTFSIVRKSGGTAFTAGAGVLLVTIRQREQARR
jgi:hypothetical protein